MTDNEQPAASKTPAMWPTMSATPKAAKVSGPASAAPGRMPTARDSISRSKPFPLDRRVALRVVSEKKE